MDAYPSCSCLQAPRQDLFLTSDLGMDQVYGEVTLLACPQCGRHWLRYTYENEAFSRSGRWYLGHISRQQARRVTVGEARELLARLDWYFYGGSYFDGRVGKTAGPLA